MSGDWFARIARFAAVAVVMLLVVGAQPSGAQPAAPQPPEPTINPATGEPFGAPTGCCCFPAADNAPSKGPLCKPDVTEFDCKAECAELRDGRLPSGCRWTKGACPQ